MAIQDSFNITMARTDEAYAFKCWYNYNYENNTMGISSSAMGEIVTQYKGVLQNWKATVSNDENRYEINDDDFSNAVNSGYKEAAQETGYEGGGKGGMIVRGCIDGTAGLAGGLMAAGVNLAGKTATEAIGGTIGGVWGKVIGGKLAGKGVVKLGDKGVTEAFNTAGKAGNQGGAAGKAAGEKSSAWIITAPLALATGTFYQAKKPNKEQHEAALELMNSLLPDAQAQSAEAQGIMEEADSELIELADEAEAANEDANDDIEDDKSEFDLYKASYDALIKKVESGETLSEEEKELLKQLVPLMQQLGEDISELNEDTIQYIQDLYGDMESYQEYYDSAAETIANVLGITEYAESFDETARTMMYVEAGAQTLNAASGAKAAYQAGRFAASGGWLTAWAWAFVAMGTAGATMSGLGAAEQFKWASDTGAEIDFREMTQDLNSATSDVYDERVQDYEGYMDIVGDLEIEVPDDTEAPEEVPQIPEGGDTEEPNGTTTQPTNNTNPTNNGSIGGDIGQNDNYSTVMGYGADYIHIIRGDMPVEQGTVFVNNKNKVVMSQAYADAITQATGDDTGKRYSTDLIPKIISNLLPEPFDEKMIKQVMNGKKLDSEYSAKLINAVSGEVDGETTVDNTDKATSMAKKVVDFYSAIFKGAATRGWTTGSSEDLDSLKKVKVS